MNYSEVIAQSIQYMKDHPEEKITASSMAKRAGYSLYHFCHLFKAATGISPGEYHRRLRLIRAAESIRDGMPVTEAAFRYGFESSAGFTKAIRRHYGLPPSKLDQVFGSKEGNWQEPLPLLINGTKAAEIPGLSPSPELIRVKECYAYGYQIDPVDSEQAGGADKDQAQKKEAAFWQKVDFGAYPKYPKGANDLGEVGAWIDPDEAEGRLSYFFGYHTDDGELPEGFARLDIPSGQYMRFPAGPDPDRIRSVWHYIFTKWFETTNPYLFREEGLCFEYYQGNNAWIYIPVR